MISLPPELTPSELYYDEEVAPFVRELLQSCRALRREGRLREAERCAQDALEAGREKDASAARGAALVHLADIHRDEGRLGPALADCESAYPILHRLTSRHQRHNEAVAAYALGLVHQLLGSELDALRWYQDSLDLFEQARQDWAVENAQHQTVICTRARRWMETLSEYLTVLRSHPEGNQATSVWVPIILPAREGGGFAIAQLEIDRYRIERELTVDGRTLYTRPLKGRSRILLEPHQGYYVRKVPDDEKALKSMGAREGDYVLIGRRPEAERAGPGVLETLAGPQFGRFKRDEEGNFKFVRADAQVLGSADVSEGQVGHVAALLRPIPGEAPTPSVEPPSPEPSPPPPPQSAFDPPDLRERLAGVVSDDRKAEDRE